MAHRDEEHDYDPSRRAFFKQFGRQTIENAGAVAGAAAEIRRTSLAAARELLDMNNVTSPESPATRTVPTPALEASTPPETFRSAYRHTGASLVVLDQRELPGQVLTFECDGANDVASALRSGAITPGPVMGQVAAYGVALAAASAIERSDESRDQVVRAAADGIKAARGEVRAVGWAVNRLVGLYNELASQAADGAAISERITSDADRIALETTAACADVGRLWAVQMVGDRIDLLMHGDSGPLACGMVGMSTSGIRALQDGQRQVHVWVTEGQPSGEGKRITALQLTQLDIPHTVIPDSAVGWLLASRKLDAVVLRGDTIAANGEAVAPLGSLSIAQLASGAGVSVHVLAPEMVWDASRQDAGDLVLDLRSAAELGSSHRARLNPPFDVVPARFVSAYVSEHAIVRPSLEATT